MTRRRLLKSELFPEADVRPTLLGIVTLLFLLLFFLLSTSTGQRLGVIDIKAEAAMQMASLPHAGLVKEVQVVLQGDLATVVADVQTTDIAAASTATERRMIPIAPRTGGGLDLVGLGAALKAIKDIDPSQEKVVLVPDQDTRVDALFGVMDTARGAGTGTPLYPSVTLGGQGS